MKHQIKLLRYGLKTKHPAFLAEMRTGKTLTAIRWVQEIDARTVIVIAPLTVLEAWERELSSERELYVNAYGLSFQKRLTSVKTAYESKKRTWLLVNYEMVRTTDIISKLAWDVVLLDESRKIGNPSSLITKACVKGFRLAKHRAILSGLPRPESDLELFSQFQFLHGEFLGCRDFWQFRAKYFHRGNFRHSWYGNKGTRSLIKKTVHSLGFVLTRHDARMPDTFVYETRTVEMTPEQKKLYKQIEKEYAYGVGENRIETKWVLTKENWLRKLAGGFTPEEEALSTRKAEEVLEILAEVSGKVVVWFDMKHELSLVSRLLKRAKIPFEVITGEIAYKDRKKALERLRERSRVLLATEAAAPYGVDCSCADTAVYYSNAWSFNLRNQSKDRIYHPKKTSPLLVIDLVTKGTVDEEVVRLLKEKDFESGMFMLRLQRRLRNKYANL